MKNIRLEATKYIWTAIAVIMGLLYGGTIVAEQSIGVEHVIITLVLGIASFLSTGVVWNWGDVKFENEFIEASANEKSKRSRKLDRMLKRLNDEDLEALREHLTYENEPYAIGEDGELMYMEKK
jgi:hypothetical protein